MPVFCDFRYHWYHRPRGQQSRFRSSEDDCAENLFCCFSVRRKCRPGGKRRDRIASKVRSVRRSSQFGVKKFARPTVGKVSRGGVVMRSIMTREGMTLTRIAVDRCVRFLSKCRFNLHLRSLGNELILFGDMHEKGRMKPIDLSQIFLGIGAVIPDRGVDAVVAHDCHEDHQRAEAIAEQGNLAVAFRETACGVNGVLYVPYACISVISRIEAKAVLPVGLGGDVQVEARLLPPVQVWSDREVTLFRQFIAVLTNVGVHPKQFLQNDNGRSRCCLRSCDIGGERAALSFYRDVIFHSVLLRRPLSSGPPPMSSESAEAR